MWPGNFIVAWGDGLTYFKGSAMNYYEHHIGDYDQATAHLTAVEDGIYCRLLRKYYATERALTADIQALQRLVRAREPEERAAVETVLNEFFVLEDDGWHQKRCDEDIARYHERLPKSEEKRANSRERQHRARERRKQLFADLRDYGVTAPFDATTYELEELLSRVTQSELNEAVTHPVTQHVTQPVTRDNTATHTPTPTPTPTPDKKTKAQAPPDSVSLPEWLSPEPFAAFIDHRKKLKAPMTGLAQTRLIAELSRLREDGHDPEAVLDQSILNGWKGVFPLKAQQSRSGGSKAARQQRDQEWLNELTGRNKRSTIIDITPARVVD